MDGHGTAGRTELERARVALLNFLARVLGDADRALTTIVFDAKQAPPGLPSELVYAEMQIRFARGYPSADDLIEELIAANHSPRQLVVVSSDHRLHRAARRRKATPLDSDVWISSLTRRDRPTPTAVSNSASQNAATAPPVGDADETATRAWLSEFGDVDVAAIQADIQRETPVPPQRAEQPATEPPPRPAADQEFNSDSDEELRKIFPPEFFTSGADDDEHGAADDWNPFPPGYGADIADDEAR